LRKPYGRNKAGISNISHKDTRKEKNAKRKEEGIDVCSINVLPRFLPLLLFVLL
jgi:hypothetical protein